MKKSLKFIGVFVFALIAAIIGNSVVYAADSAPSSFKASTHTLAGNPLGLTSTINVKKTTDGKYIYCLDVNKNLPTSSIRYTKGELINDPAINYIIASGYNDSTDLEFFATQAALWIHLVDTNQMSDTNNGYVSKIKNAVYSSKNTNDSVAKSIKSKLDGAKKAASNGSIIFEITTSDVKFTLKSGKYVSNTVKVNSNIGNNYSVYLYSQPAGTEVTKTSTGFYLTIPAENVNAGKTDIGVVIQDKTTKYNVYKYAASNSSYQDMLVVYSEETYVNDNISMPIIKDNARTTIVVSKQDVTNRGVELSGATLVIRNSKGTIVERWVSGNKPVEFDDLAVGTYTLSETSAPAGYELNTKSITFTVSNNGKVENLVMYNTPKGENIVTISKQDIMTKYELPGATLVIKDVYGRELYRWVSGNEPYIIRGINEGTYTLEEIVAPEGYRLSSEKITFEVENNGVVTELVMFNTPISDIIFVPPTGMNAKTITYVLGGLILAIGSVLVYKNVKKEQ